MVIKVSPGRDIPVNQLRPDVNRLQRLLLSVQVRGL